ALLGASTIDGRLLDTTAFTKCPDCVVLSHDFWRRQFQGRLLTPALRISLDGRERRIAGVLQPRFWFLSRRIAVWTVGAGRAGERTGVVVRLRPGVTTREAEEEIQTIMQDAGVSQWDSMVQLSPLQPRVRAVFWSFALALSLAIVVVATGLLSRLATFKLDW